MSFTFHITPPFNQPPHAYFHGLIASGEGIGDEVVQIADRFYLLDLNSEQYRIATIPAFKPQEDITQRPGEATLSNVGLWRRHTSSWHHGAGQIWHDRDDSDSFRFRDSKGVDPFERWELSLLPDTETVVTETAEWTSMVVGYVGGEPFLIAGGGAGSDRAVRIDEAGTVTEITGLIGRVWVASTGVQVYLADDNGIHALDAAGTSIDSFNSHLTGAKIWAAKDRLIAATGAQLWDVVDSTTGQSADTPLALHPWPGWDWTGVTDEGEFIYACGFSGDRSLVYSVGIETDGTGLLPPIVALSLPDGEVAYSIQGYVGFIAVGTSQGLRICQAAERGLVAGPLVGVPEDESSHPVRAIEGHERYLWFGQDQLFVDDAGLGRVDLSVFVDALAPAYATDLMSGVSDTVTAVTTYDARRWFAVGDTIYRQSDSLVSDGFLDTGRITMNITDHKVAVYVDLRHDALPSAAEIDVFVANATRGFELRGTSAITGTVRPPDVINTHHSRTLWHEIRVVLDRRTSVVSPVLTATTLAAQPVPDRSYFLILPLLLHEEIVYRDQKFMLDLNEEFNFLTGLSQSQQLIRFRKGDLSFLSFVEDFEWQPYNAQQDGRFYQGTMVLRLKTAEVER